MKNFYLYISAIVFTFYFSAVNGCDAPRVNPLDPLNPDRPFTEITGTVKTIGFPNNPVSGVTVYWSNDNILTHTNANGQFTIKNLHRTDGWLKFDNEGFISESLFVNWQTGEKKNISVFMNSKPVLDSIELYSIVVNRFQYLPTSDLFVRAVIIDRDGINDVDSVFLKCRELNFLKNLVYNASSGFFESKITINELRLSSIDEVIGKRFEIIVQDLKGRSFPAGESSVKRIIKQEIEIISPANYAEISLPLRLNWKRYTPGFSFDYLIQISTDTSPPELVWEAINVSSDSVSYPVDIQLPAGEYYWNIWAVDEFKNRTRSKPATFVIN